MRRLAPALLALALGLTACGTDDPAPSAGPEPQQLVVQAAGGEGELKAVQGVIDAFMAKNPGVKVSFTGIPNQGDHIAKLATSFAAGSPPDVFLLNYRRLGAFVDRGVVADVPFRTVKQADLYPQSVEAFSYGGKPACLPSNTSSTVAYVNEKLFSQAGVPLPAADWTWADMETAAKAFDAKGIAGVGFDSGTRTVAPFVYSGGGDVVDDTAKPTRFTLDTAQGRAALTYLDRLQDYGVDATARAATPPTDLFAQGKLAIFLDSRRAVPAFRKAQGLAFDVRPLPRKDAATPSRSLLASDAYCVAKASQSPSLAASFAEFAVGTEGGTVLAQSGRTVPALRTLAQSTAFLDPAKAPKSSQVWLDVIPTLKRLPNVAGQDEAESAADDLIEQYLAGKAELEKTVASISTATAEAYAAKR